MRFRLFILLVMFLLALTPFPAGAQGSTFIVNSTGDSSDANSGDGICETANLGECTLRAAIEQANSIIGTTDMINFNISGGGSHSIQPTSALPTITDPVIIDGTTQPGFTDNPIVELDGSMANAGPPPPSVHGLLITAGSSTVRGLVINRFSTGSGIRLTLKGGNVIEGNFLGTDVMGKVAQGNFRGVSIINSPHNTIGGTSSGAGNLISGNNQAGIFILGIDSTENLVQGNFIGTQEDGTGPLGNLSTGVFFTFDASENTIGGLASGANNTVAFNYGGVLVFSGKGNAILSNSIFSNGTSLSNRLGIDLEGTDQGVSLDDVGDGDEGANNLQNFPVLTSVNSASGNTTIEGTLNSTANTTFRLQFFSNTDCSPSNHGEGENFLGWTFVSTALSGNASFTVSFPTMVPHGTFITGTATDPFNNTSEFPQCATAYRVDVVDIDIKPGSDPNCFNNDGHGVIPVAVLTTDDFDAATVDPFTLALDGATVRVKGKSGNAGAMEDVDNDGDLDLVVQIEDIDGVYSEGDSVATLTGETIDGTPIEGTDTICIVPGPNAHTASTSRAEQDVLLYLPAIRR